MTWREAMCAVRFKRLEVSPMSNYTDAAVSSAGVSYPAPKDQQGHVDALPDAGMIVDPSGRLLMVNDQAGALFGYRAQELLNQPVNLLLPERFLEVHDALRAEYAAHSRARPLGSGLKVLGRHHDGHELQVDISLNPLLDAG